METEKSRPIEWIVGIIFWGIAAVSLLAMLSSFFVDESPSSPSSRNPQRPATIEPYPGYRDGVDQDCGDLEPRKNIWVGNYDPDNLDRDGDGWGCEG